MVNPVVVALAIEGLGFAYQKIIKGHPAKCMCSTCLVINISIPVTLSLVVALGKK